MKKVQLEVIGISSKLKTNPDYNLVLKEVNGNRNVSINLNYFDTQLLYDAFHNSNNNIYDVIPNLINKTGYELQEIILEKNEITQTFESSLLCSKIDRMINTSSSDNSVDNIELNTNIIDAVLLGIRTGKRIIADDEVLKQNTYNEDFANDEILLDDKLEMCSTIFLETMLQKAIDTENYEQAAIIRDELNKRS